MKTKKPDDHFQCMPITGLHNYFLRSSQLGVIEGIVTAIWEDTSLSKRQRQVRFREAVRALKLTKLVPLNATVHGLSAGTNALGDAGIFAALEVPVAVRAELPEQLEALSLPLYICPHCTAVEGNFHVPGCIDAAAYNSVVRRPA